MNRSGWSKPGGPGGCGALGASLRLLLAALILAAGNPTWAQARPPADAANNPDAALPRAASAAAATATAEASGTPPTPPVGDGTGELLVSGLPDGWRVVHVSNLPELRITEFAPPADSTLDELIRVELSAIARDVDPLHFLDSQSADFAKSCAGGKDSHVWSGFEDGNPTALRLFLCPFNRSSKRGHITLMKAINGADGFYLVARTRLTEPYNSPQGEGWQPMPRATMAEWVSLMRQVRVLPPAAPSSAAESGTTTAP